MIRSFEHCTKHLDRPITPWSEIGGECHPCRRTRLKVGPTQEWIHDFGRPRRAQAPAPRPNRHFVVEMVKSAEARLVSIVLRRLGLLDECPELREVLPTWFADPLLGNLWKALMWLHTEDPERERIKGFLRKAVMGTRLSTQEAETFVDRLVRENRESCTPRMVRHCAQLVVGRTDHPIAHLRDLEARVRVLRSLRFEEAA